MKPRLLDLFCGAGGASKGYADAGFEVVGVDIEPQPRYPFDFIQGDALKADLDGFDAVHASPPCQAFSFATAHRGLAHRSTHPDLIEPTRELLDAAGLPSIIENVAGAPIRPDLVLCGEMFGLRLHRHRFFELDRFFAMRTPHQPHTLKAARHNCHIEDGHTRMVVGNYADHESASAAMGIDWMNRDELRLAIPPAYTAYIGEALLAHLEAQVAA